MGRLRLFAAIAALVTAVAPAVARAAVAPEASVTIVDYSATISGDIGETVPGVKVTLALKRPAPNSSERVAEAITATDATGRWSTDLSPALGFGAPGDSLMVDYAAPAGSPSTPVPASFNYILGGNVYFQGAKSTIAQDGSNVTSGPLADCSELRFIVDGTSEPTTASGKGCQFTPSHPLGDNDHVQASYTTEVTDLAGDKSILNTVDDLGLPGQTGAPTCTADLVLDQVSCGSLDPFGLYAVLINGTTEYGLDTGRPTYLAQSPGFAVVPGLKAGDTIALLAGDGPRHLTTLHVSQFQVGFRADGSVGAGSCQARKALLPGGLCVNGGDLLYDGGGTPREFDDLSGGATILSIPSLTDLAPAAGNALPPGAFTSYADISADQRSAYFPLGPGPYKSYVSSIDLAIDPFYGGSQVFAGPMTPQGIGDYETETVNGIPSGRYVASWTMTDVNGDTRQYQNDFVIEPGAVSGPPGPPGPTGATGATGATGPAGKDGNSELVKCTTQKRTKKTGKGKHRKTVTVKRTVCAVTRLSPGTRVVSIRISRGHTRLGSAGTVVRHGKARVVLPALRPGRYVITIVSTTNKQATIKRASLNIRR